MHDSIDINFEVIRSFSLKGFQTIVLEKQKSLDEKRKDDICRILGLIDTERSSMLTIVDLHFCLRKYNRKK